MSVSASSEAGEPYLQGFVSGSHLERRQEIVVYILALKTGLKANR